MVLPLLGGSPAVWNACMVFFQALLLLGYLYAHHVAGKYEPKKQWLIHLVVLGLPIGGVRARGGVRGAAQPHRHRREPGPDRRIEPGAERAGAADGRHRASRSS